MIVLMTAVSSMLCSAQDKTFDPNMKVYLDPVYYQAHHPDCISNGPLKQYEKTMTLAEADKAGVWLEASPGRYDNCNCLGGYQRKHPLKPIPDDTYVIISSKKKWTTHGPGCHRLGVGFSIGNRRTIKEAKEQGYDNLGYYCCKTRWTHATISEEDWKKLPMEHAPGLLPFTDPAARGKLFLNYRYFFNSSGPLGKYRGTGDEKYRVELLDRARVMNEFSLEVPGIAQHKARDPEGLNYMCDMAAYARVTLQLARKQPGAVSKDEIEEAETFLKTMLMVLEPTWEAKDDLHPEVGLPNKVVHEFVARAFNRAMNGYGTLAVMTAALEDLQALKKTTEYQPQIDRYRKVVREYIKHFKSRGHFCSKFNGKTHFYYAYASRDEEENPRIVDGCKILGRPEDNGHFRYTVLGLTSIYESSRDLGVDDEFLTAVANSLYHNAAVAVKEYGKARAGLIQCPIGYQAGRKSMKGKNFSNGPTRDAYYRLYSFVDEADYLDVWSGKKGISVKQAGDEALYGQYLKELRKDPTLLYLGEKK